MSDRSLVAITVVTFNSSRYIRRCLESALLQDYQPITVVVVDNASSDETASILRDFEDKVIVVYNQENTGFAAAQNQAIELANADWVLTLNPDLLLTSNFVSNLVAHASVDDAVGSACGKLLALSQDLQPIHPPVFDSTGIYVTPNMRHFDRGSLQPDCGQYEEVQYVFGGTGAACLYRRAMIEDISLAGEFFDNDFFAYREDADVAWRAQLMGWKCLYVPAAVAHHVRSVLPSNRSQLSPIINMHSVKNRWLLRIKNMTAGLYRRYWLPITLRDLLVVAGCLFREWPSLHAFSLVARSWRKTWGKRRQIMARRRASDEYIEAWFRHTPVSYPAKAVATALADREKIATR
jgi:GT2 family glycosyltransferase